MQNIKKLEQSTKKLLSHPDPNPAPPSNVYNALQVEENFFSKKEGDAELPGDKERENKWEMKNLKKKAIEETSKDDVKTLKQEEKTLKEAKEEGISKDGVKTLKDEVKVEEETLKDEEKEDRRKSELFQLPPNRLEDKLVNEELKNIFVNLGVNPGEQTTFFYIEMLEKFLDPKKFKEQFKEFCKKEVEASFEQPKTKPLTPTEKTPEKESKSSDKTPKKDEKKEEKKEGFQPIKFLKRQIAKI